MTLSQSEIADRIPHRHENLLLDSCTISKENESEFEINISNNDALNRQIFLYNFNSERLIPSSLLTEISALACIASAGKIPKGTFAYFAGITNFTLESPLFQASLPLKGKTKKISDKNGFFKYGCHVYNANGASAHAHLMAYYDSSGVEQPLSMTQVELPDEIQNARNQNGSPVDANPHKSFEMTFVHFCNFNNQISALYSYQYPSSHPLIRGHFPSNPVMMGICQWQMLEDAMTHYINYLYPTKKDLPHQQCDAIIFKSNGTPVCEIKGAAIETIPVNPLYQAYIKRVKKVLFKQRVFPGDTLFIYLKIFSDIQS